MDLYGRLVHDVLFPGFEAARGRPTLGLMRDLDRTQWASADELHAIQSGLLRRLVRHAYHHTPWYKARLDERGLTPDDVRTPPRTCTSCRCSSGITRVDRSTPAPATRRRSRPSPRSPAARPASR